MRYAAEFVYVAYYSHDRHDRVAIADHVAPYGGVVVDFIAEGDSGGNPEAVIAFDSLEKLQAYMAVYYDNDQDDIADAMKYVMIMEPRRD